MSEGPATRAATGDRALRYAELDREAFVERTTTLHPDGERSVTLGLDGIHCAACIWLLERLPRVVPGVVEARVDFRRSTIAVRWRDDEVTLSRIAEGIASLGYRPHPLRTDDRAARRRAADRRRLIAMGVAFAAAGNNMLIAGSLYLGLFSYMDGEIEQLLRWATCLVGLVSLAWPGRTFFVGAYNALRSRTPHMDLPVALGLAVGGLAGVINTLRGTGELYFDTLSVLVFLLLVGRWIQLRQQRHAAAALEVLYRVTPRTAHKLVEGGFAEVPAEVLQPGDVVAVAAGASVPADGTVIAGSSSVDEQVLTGESTPVAVAPGSKVAAGSVNVGARLQINVDAVGEDTRMGKVLALVEQQHRPRIVQLADRIGGWFVIVVLSLSTLTFAGWLAVEPSAAVDHAVALLIVACPCALALATPLAIAVALGRAARRKILIKGGDALQRLSTPGSIWLDKTGTLTEGRMAVVAWHGDASVAGAVAALERHSTHPVARALVHWGQARADGVEPAVTDVEQRQGGVIGVVEGRTIAVGNAPFVSEHIGAVIDLPTRSTAGELLEQGASPVYVALEGRIVAVAGVGDPLRTDARAAVDELTRRGWTVGILSGDHPDIVAGIGRTLGLPEGRVHGGLHPEDKVRWVADHGPDAPPTVMVGDGVNDSAALAAASVGIATRDGAEASLQAAPVYLGRPGLSGVIELLDASAATMRGIRRNFVVSLAYNAIAVALAATGHISPLVAAILMPISSLSVVALSLSLRFGPRSEVS